MLVRPPDFEGNDDVVMQLQLRHTRIKCLSEFLSVIRINLHHTEPTCVLPSWQLNPTRTIPILETVAFDLQVEEVDRIQILEGPRGHGEFGSDVPVNTLDKLLLLLSDFGTLSEATARSPCSPSLPSSLMRRPTGS